MGKEEQEEYFGYFMCNGEKKKRPPYERFLRSVKFQLNRI